MLGSHITSNNPIVSHAKSPPATSKLSMPPQPILT